MSLHVNNEIHTYFDLCSDMVSDTLYGSLSFLKTFKRIQAKKGG